MKIKRHTRASVGWIEKMSFLLLCVQLIFTSCHAQKGLPEAKSQAMDKSIEYPSLMITKAGVEAIKGELDNAPLFKATLQKTIAEVDAEIEIGVKVPIPKDMSGGYTHERHKQNFFILQKAGYLFQITGDEKYAEYIRESFLAYAEMYPTLPKHPTDRSYATGKIFWQCLNDANWLVYCSQAYDCVYEWLSPEDRETMESQLFRPLADFLSIENPQYYNRVHNHSTWGCAAVGMIGLVMNDKELIDRALYGIQDDGIDPNMIDNDGGYIKKEGVRKAGFLAQLDYSFSPDGHFTEGPYYLRYAMTPFLLFSKSLANKLPEFNIYSYRDNILEKAVYSLLYESDSKGRFFPINDAQKGMSWLSREVIAAVDIAYADFGMDPMLLSIAQKQGSVLLDESGFKVARDINKGLTTPFAHKSIAYSDGAEGTKGGLGILRSSNGESEEICLVMKYAAHGMGHGHFDKLSYSLYDVEEVVQDYGAARWVNIDQKGGGRYLKENNTFAKQTIAHNTVAINQESHYKGKVKEAEAAGPDLYFFDASDKSIQVVSAKEQYAYADQQMHRTMVMIDHTEGRPALLVDIFRVTSNTNATYDKPLWFMGHLLRTNFDINTETTSLTTLGTNNGYQHIWKEGTSALSEDKVTQMTWFGNNRFYTITSASQENDEMILARGGANDPSFNIRHDPVYIQRRSSATNTTFVDVIESHGTYDPVTEIPLTPFPEVSIVELLIDTPEYTAVNVSLSDGRNWKIIIANQDASQEASHVVSLDGEQKKWRGPYLTIKG